MKYLWSRFAFLLMIFALQSYASSPPTSSNHSLTVNWYTTYGFQSSDFPFVDDSTSNWTYIKINSLPTSGSLIYNSNAVQVGDSITYGSIANLNYSASSGSLDGFTFYVKDDTQWSVNTSTINITLNPPPNPQPQTITKVPVGIIQYGDVLRMQHTATSGLNVQMMSYNPSICQVFGGDSLKAVGVGTCMIQLQQYGNSQYYAAPMDYDTIQVNTRGISFSNPNGIRKVYDGNKSVPTSGIQTTGVLAGDTVTVTRGVLSFMDSTEGMAKQISVVGTTISGPQASKYSVVNPLYIYGDIDPKPLQVKADAKTKVYGQADPTFTWTATGYVSGESYNGNLDLYREQGQNVGAYEIFLGEQRYIPNYDIQFTPDSLKITPLALALSGISIQSKDFNGTRLAQVNGGALMGVLSSDTVSFVYDSALFNDANVGTNKPVQLMGLRLQGPQAANYTVVAPTGLTGEIRSIAQPQYITWITALPTSIAYGNTPGGVLSQNAQVTSNLSIQFSTITSNVCIYDQVNSKIKTLDTGRCILRSEQIGNQNWLAVQRFDTIQITPRTTELNISGLVVQNKTYDGTTVATVTGGTLSGVIPGDTVSFVLTQMNFASANVGNNIAVNGAFNVLGPQSRKYQGHSLAPLMGNILPARSAQTIALNGPDTVMYGDPGIVLVATASSGLAVSWVSETPQKCSFGPEANKLNFKTAGICQIRGTQMGDASFLAADTVRKSIFVKRALVNLTQLGGIQKEYDRTKTVNLTGGQLTGVIGTDTVAFTHGVAVFVDSLVGSQKQIYISGSTLSGPQAFNYNFPSPFIIQGSILPKLLTLTNLSIQDKFYNGSVGAVVMGGTLNGVLAGESVSFAVDSAIYANPNPEMNKPANLSGLRLVGTHAMNYAIVPPTGLTGNILSSSTSSSSGTSSSSSSFNSSSSSVISSSSSVSSSSVPAYSLPFQVANPIVITAPAFTEWGMDGGAIHGNTKHEVAMFPESDWRAQGSSKVLDTNGSVVGQCASTNTQCISNWNLKNTQTALSIRSKMDIQAWVPASAQNFGWAYAGWTIIPNVDQNINSQSVLDKARPFALDPNGQIGLDFSYSLGKDLVIEFTEMGVDYSTGTITPASLVYTGKGRRDTLVVPVNNAKRQSWSVQTPFEAKNVNSISLYRKVGASTAGAIFPSTEMVATDFEFWGAKLPTNMSSSMGQSSSSGGSSSSSTPVNGQIQINFANIDQWGTDGGQSWNDPTGKKQVWFAPDADVNEGGNSEVLTPAGDHIGACPKNDASCVPNWNIGATQSSNISVASKLKVTNWVPSSATGWGWARAGWILLPNVNPSVTAQSPWDKASPFGLNSSGLMEFDWSYSAGKTLLVEFNGDNLTDPMNQTPPRFSYVGKGTRETSPIYVSQMKRLSWSMPITYDPAMVKSVSFYRTVSANVSGAPFPSDEPVTTDFEIWGAKLPTNQVQPNNQNPQKDMPIGPYTLNVGFAPIVEKLSTKYIDPDGDGLGYMIESKPAFIQANIMNDTLNILPMSQMTGQGILVLKVTDTKGGLLLDTIPVSVAGGNNQAPKFVSAPNLNFTADFGVHSVFVPQHVADLEKDPLTYSVNSTTGKVAAFMDGDTLRINSLPGMVGADTLVVKAFDQNPNPAVAYWIVNVNPKSNIISRKQPLNDLNLEQDFVPQLVKLSNYYDGKNGEWLQYEVRSSGAAVGMNVKSDTILINSMSGVVGIETIYIRVFGAVSGELFDTMLVNVKPKQQNMNPQRDMPIGPYTLNVGFAPIVEKLSQNYMDPDGDGLGYMIESKPAFIQANIMNDTLSIIPMSQMTGQGILVLKVTDTKGGLLLDTIPVSVAGGNNQAPKFVSAPNLNFTTDFGTRSIFVPQHVQDLEKDPLTYAVNSTTGKVAAFMDGDTLRINSLPGMVGADTLVVKAFDQNPNPAVAYWIVNVNDRKPNTAPSFALVNPMVQLKEALNPGEGLKVIPAWATQISAGELNQPYKFEVQAIDPVTIQALGGLQVLFKSAPQVDSLGVLRFEVNPNVYTYIGRSFDFKVRLRDQGGTQNGGVDTSAWQNFYIQIAGINQAPVASKAKLDTLQAVNPGQLEVVGNWLPVFGLGNPFEDKDFLQGSLSVQVLGADTADFAKLPVVDLSKQTISFQVKSGRTGLKSLVLLVKDQGGVQDGGVDSLRMPFVLNIKTAPQPVANIEPVFPQLGQNDLPYLILQKGWEYTADMAASPKKATGELYVWEPTRSLYVRNISDTNKLPSAWKKLDWNVNQQIKPSVWLNGSALSINWVDRTGFTLGNANYEVSILDSLGQTEKNLKNLNSSSWSWNFVPVGKHQVKAKLFSTQGQVLASVDTTVEVLGDLFVKTYAPTTAGVSSWTMTSMGEVVPAGQTWQHWDPSASLDPIRSRYKEYTSVSKINPAWGAWLNLDQGARMDYSTKSLKDSVVVELLATNEGWNQIANPYPFELGQNAVKNGDGLTCWQWDRIKSDYVQKENPGPFEACWINVTTNRTVTFYPIPNLMPKKTTAANARSDYNGLIEMNLKAAAYQDSGNVFGLSQDLVMSEIPSPVDGRIRVSFVNQGREYQKLARTELKNIWNIKLQSGVSGLSQGTLSFNGLSELAKSEQALYFRLANATWQKVDSQISVPLSRQGVNAELQIGSAQVAPTLMNNYHFVLGSQSFDLELREGDKPLYLEVFSMNGALVERMTLSEIRQLNRLEMFLNGAYSMRLVGAQGSKGPASVQILN